VRHGQKLDDGRAITKELVRQIVREENDKVKAQIGAERYAAGRYEDAAQLMIELVEQPVFHEFLTLPAYDRIIADEKKAA
jgi:malate synthase